MRQNALASELLYVATRASRIGSSSLGPAEGPTRRFTLPDEYTCAEFSVAFKHTFRLPPDLARQLADYANRKRVPQAFSQAKAC